MIEKSSWLFSGALLLQLSITSPHLHAQPDDFARSLQGGLSARCPGSDLYSSQRPDPPGSATPVWVAVSLVDLLDIKDSDQTFTVDAWLILRWKDPRLADQSRGTAQALCEVDPDQLWIPRIQYRNLRNLESLYRDVTLIDSEGNVTFLQRRLVTVFSRLDLREFPFDTQILRLTVESLAGIDDVEFRVWKEGADSGEATVSGWLLSEPVASADVEQARIVRRSVFSKEIKARREPEFFTRKLIVPVALIVFMAYAIFWISPTQIAPQTGTGATAMLTLIAYQFAMSGYLPRISYLTRADFFLLWSLVLVFAALMEAMATAALMNYGKERAVRKMDRLFRVLYPVAFLLILILAVA